jgi:hypothetical protein
MCSSYIVPNTKVTVNNKSATQNCMQSATVLAVPLNLTPYFVNHNNSIRVARGQ